MNERYKEGINRNQMVLFPTSIEDMIEVENNVRVIDEFVEAINIKKLGFKKYQSKTTGQKGYAPKDMIKLLIYGYSNGIRSSRKLMREARRNIELMWLIKGIRPDFRCIAEYRKENIEGIKEAYLEFNMVCKQMNLISSEMSQDGTKIKAVNSKERNYTLNKIDDRIKHEKEKIEKYLKEVEEIDEKEKQQEILIKKEEVESKLKEYENYKKEMEEEKKSQISLTDKEAKLMKNNGKFEVCYNNQVVVERKNHLVMGYEVGDNPADSGSITRVSKEIKEQLGITKMTNITDKGYIDREDIVEALENGIVPMVTLQEGKEYIELETEYEENEISEKEKKDRNVETIKKVIRAGEIPEIYKDEIEEIKVEEKIEYQTEEEELENISEEELRDKAQKEKIFTREIKTDKVFCPEGEILRKKNSIGKDKAKYCNKLACKRCKNPCCNAEYKEIIMSKNQRVVIPKTSGKEVTRKVQKRKKIKKKVVKIKFKINKELIKERMGISEHIHASMKVWDNASYYLLKGKEKVGAEAALYYLSYNIRRVINVVGVRKLIDFLKNEYKQTRDVCAQKQENIEEIGKEKALT